MASLSPALLSSRPGAFIDPHRPAEYPVLLGDSLQDTSRTKNQFFNVQYNWKPKNTSLKQKTVITKADPESSAEAAYQLTIHESTADSKPFKYAGNVKTEPFRTGSTKPSTEDQTASLALVFNQEKSAFILEKISVALDFNLTSAPGQSRADAQALPQLSSSKKQKQPITNVDNPAANPSDDEDEDDDSDPDLANPYDFRHFLEEAKANAEKGLGSRTPIPGGLSGFPSPVPGASRFKASSRPGTPVHKPATSALSAPVKRRKNSDKASRDTARSSAGTTQKTNATKPRPKPLPSTSSSSSSSSKPIPLSKARVSGSDEEIGDTITLSRPSKKPPATAASSSASYAASPRIEVDEAAGLVIDMGSPPPAARRRLGAGFASPFAIARARPSRDRASAAAHGTSMLDSEEEVEEEDAQGEPDDGVDVLMRDVNGDVDVGPGRNGDADADGDVDGDVEDLVLGSPRASTTRAPSVSVSRVGADADRGEEDEDEDEDDELAAELEAALENDDEDGDGNGSGSGDGVGVGLGISTGAGGSGGGVGEGEDESEVSEEE